MYGGFKFSLDDKLNVINDWTNQWPMVTANFIAFSFLLACYVKINTGVEDCMDLGEKWKGTHTLYVNGSAL